MKERSRPIAKLVRPWAGELLRRERLFAVLDAARRGKAAWISAPGGAGKTSLAASWIEARRLPCLWLALDAGDADPASFFFHLTMAARAAFGAADLPPFGEGQRADLGLFARRFFEQLFAAVEPPLVVVLDNYQALAADAPVHAATDALFASAPPGVLAVIASREAPPPRLARWLAAADLTAIEYPLLRFTRAETAALATARGMDPNGRLDRLHELARGWAAGVVLLVRGLAQGLPLPRPGDAPPTAVFDYFAVEVFDQAPPAMHAFLHRTAFLTGMTAAMAEAASGEPRAAGLLEELHRGHLFVERRDEPEAFYEYHPLFREFLIDRAIESLGAAEVTALRTRAASLLEADGQVDVAALLLIEAEDWERLTAFVRRYADDLMGRGRFQTLRSWIDAIPPQMARETPWVLLWKGICQAGAHEATYLESVRQACVLFDTAGDFVGSFSARIWRIRLSRSLSELDECMAELESLADRHFKTVSAEEEVEILGTFGRFRFDPRLSADHPLLARLIQRAAELARLHGDPSLRLRMVNFIGSAVSLSGDYARLESIVSEHRHLIDDPGIGAGDRLNFMIVMALLRSCQGAWDEVRTIIARVRELVETTGFSGHEATLATAALRCYMSLGEMESARAATDRLAWLAGSSAMARIHFLNAKIHVSVADGDLAVARDAMAELLQLVPPSASFRSRVECLNGLLLLELGDLPRAIEQLRAAKSLAGERNQPICLYSALLLLALAQWRTGASGPALKHLGEGLATGRHSRMRVGIPWFPRRLFSEICEIALRNAIEVETARDLVLTLKLEPPSVASADWPWPVRVRLLGRFELEASGGGDEPRKSKGRKQPKKPFELLKFLVAHGGAGVSVGVATDSLWPEAEGDAGRKAFEITLHRLRKLLGSDDAVRLEGGKLSLSQAVCWIDCFAFERLAEQAETRDPAADADRADGVATRALALYRGGFLTNEGEHRWAAPYREKLRAKFLRLVALAGERLESTGCADEAERWYRKALELDVTAEPIYRRLMRSLAAQGRSAEAIEVYRRCREMLSIVLATKPSPETEAVYLRLRDEGA
jgi:LuxR family transcriptional regulator, maltose regulon positive regulatory protein